MLWDGVFTIHLLALSVDHSLTLLESVPYGLFPRKLLINSMNVVQYIGAQEGLQTRAEIQRHLNKRPDHYRVERLN